MKIYDYLKNVIAYNNEYVFFKVKEEFLIASYNSGMDVDVFFQSPRIDKACELCDNLSIELPVSIY